MGLFDDYIDNEMATRIWKKSNAIERRALRATVNETNCLSRFRGWKTDEDKEKVLDALRNNRLYFSTARGYNDPYDTLMYVNQEKFIHNIMDSWQGMEKYVEKLKLKDFVLGSFAEAVATKSNPNLKDFQIKFLSEIYEDVESVKKQIHENIKGICFSENKLSSLMWAHYANNHYGIALWYDKYELIGAKCYTKDHAECKSRFELEPVRYRDKRVDATEFVNAYILEKRRMRKGAERFDTEIEWPVVMLQTVKDIALTKDSSWSYEKEVRLIPKKLEFEAPSDASYIGIKPRAIVFGAKCEEQDRKEIVSIAKKLGDITLYEAYLRDDQSGYSVRYQEYE